MFSALLQILGRPLIEAAVSAFGHVMLDFFRTWRAGIDAQARGRAEAVAEAATEVARVERDMGAVSLPERDELLKRLNEGTA